MAIEDPTVISVDGIYDAVFDDDPVILSERSVAPTAKANKVIIYAIDNGSGKTKLMAQFPTGAPVQLAIQP